MSTSDMELKSLAKDIPVSSAALSDSAAPNEVEKQYPTRVRLVVVFFLFAFTYILVTLDQTIVATATPVIASHFSSFDEVAWIPGAYFLTEAGFILITGQLLTVIPGKTVYIIAVALFELGSLICAVSQTMPTLIVGRAIAGVGGAAIFPSITILLVQLTRLEERPIFLGFLGMTTSIGVIFGPILGGLFTDHVTWRWCFYINLPFGLTALAVIYFVVQVEAGLEPTTLRQKLKTLDFLGSILYLGVTACLLVPLQWGGNSKPWNSPVVISLLCVFGVLLLAFVGCEWKRGMRAIVPIPLLKDRSLVGATLEAFLIGLGIYTDVYFIPLWYQVQGHSATRSGIDLLPFLLAALITAGVSGAIINKIGRYWHIIVISPLLFCVGSGLLFTVRPDSPNARVIGYQILSGVGIGGALNNVYLVVHAEHNKDEKKLSQANSIVNCAQLLGGLIGVAIAGALFANQLSRNLHREVPQLSVEVSQALRASVSAISSLPVDIKDSVIKAYVESLDAVFIMGVPVGLLSTLSGLFIKDYDIRAGTKTVN